MESMFVFDIDDTLYLRSEPYLNAYYELFRDRYGLDEEKLIKANHIRKEEQFRLFAEGAISFEEMTVRRTLYTFRDMGVELTEEEAMHFEQVYSGYQKRLTMFPSFRELITEFYEKGIPMGILTNGPSDRQRKKLAAMKADRFFPEQYIMASGDVGIIKPELGIFRAFEQKTGRCPDQLWMIGDSYASDIAGARSAGWHTIWLDRMNQGTGQADYTGESEEEVCSLIRKAAALMLPPAH